MPRRFFIRIGLLLLPFAVVIGLELFVWPIDAFTFRSWEALIVHRLNRWLPGPFYPNRVLEKVEEGDLGHGSPYAGARKVLWVTDDFGFRHTSNKVEWPSVVVVGDSYAAGSSLSQDEMLDSVLARHLQMPTYAYAPRGLDAFLTDARFDGHWPRVVVYVLAEAAFQAPLVTRDTLPKHPDGLSSQPWVRTLLVLGDRLCRANMLHFLQARAENFVGDGIARRAGFRRFRNPEVWLAGDRAMLFRRYDVLNGNISAEQIADRVRELQVYQSELARHGSALIVFPVPTKSSTYYRSVPMDPSDALTRLGQACARGGIPYVSALEMFRRAADQGRMIYFAGDTHWNPEGVAIAAQLLEAPVRRALDALAQREQGVSSSPGRQ